MVLPSGVNKATGLAAALSELGLSPHNVVGVGDAENDHAFLAPLRVRAWRSPTRCRRSRSGPTWSPTARPRRGRRRADRRAARGRPRRRSSRGCARHHIPLGRRRRGGEELRLPPYGRQRAASRAPRAAASRPWPPASSSGWPSGTTSSASSIPRATTRASREPWCSVTATRAPLVKEAIELLERPDRNAVVNLLGPSPEDRPAFFDELLPRLLELRARTGRPHWIVVDEAHHLLPASWSPHAADAGADGSRAAADHRPPRPGGRRSSRRWTWPSRSAKTPADTLGAVRRGPRRGRAVRWPPAPLATGEAMAWWRRPERAAGPLPQHPAPRRAAPAPPEVRRRGARRTAASISAVPRGSSISARRTSRSSCRWRTAWTTRRGPAISATGTTRAGSARRSRTRQLADEVERIEQAPELSAQESRARMREGVERRYTGAA